MLFNKPGGYCCYLNLKLYKTYLCTRGLDRPSAMEQWAFKNVNNCLNTNIYSYLVTSGDQNSNLYLNVVHFFNASVN